MSQDDGAAGAADSGEAPSPFRPAAVSYVQIPAADAAASGRFYAGAFGWTVRGQPRYVSFADGSGHVIGAFVTDRPAAGDSGVLPYIYVSSVDRALEQVTAHGGTVAKAPYPEGDLWVATFRDPAGNVVGVWQQGPRG